MAFDELEQARIEESLRTFLEAKRPPPHIRPLSRDTNFYAVRGHELLRTWVGCVRGSMGSPRGFGVGPPVPRPRGRGTGGEVGYLSMRSRSWIR